MDEKPPISSRHWHAEQGTFPHLRSSIAERYIFAMVSLMPLPAWKLSARPMLQIVAHELMARGEPDGR
jgi:hypothetical protein